MWPLANVALLRRRFSGGFSVISRFLSGGSRLEFVVGVEGSLVEVSFYQVAVSAVRTEAGKMVASLHFSALLLRSGASRLDSCYLGFLGYVDVYLKL